MRCATSTSRPLIRSARAALAADGVGTHRDLLISPVLVWVGQYVSGIAVYPGEPGHVDGDAGFLGDFADHRRRGRLAYFNPAAGQFPIPVISTAQQKHLT
jgi:hypothetical protein